MAMTKRSNIDYRLQRVKDGEIFTEWIYANNTLPAAIWKSNSFILESLISRCAVCCTTTAGLWPWVTGFGKSGGTADFIVRPERYCLGRTFFVNREISTKFSSQQNAPLCSGKIWFWKNTKIFNIIRRKKWNYQSYIETEI